MKGLVNKTLGTLGRIFQSLVPDDETARRMGKQYIRYYQNFGH